MDAVVPAIWWFEGRNAATLARRKGRATETEVAAFLQRLDKVGIAIAELSDADTILELACRNRLTFL